MSLNNGKMKNYSFVWKRIDMSAWHRCMFKAHTPQEAIEHMRAHLARRADFPANVVVDHPFYEKSETGDTIAVHTMTQHANPFQVMHRNQVQPIDRYAPAPAAA